MIFPSLLKCHDRACRPLPIHNRSLSANVNRIHSDTTSITLYRNQARLSRIFFSVMPEMGGFESFVFIAPPGQEELYLQTQKCKPIHNKALTSLISTFLLADNHKTPGSFAHLHPAPPNTPGSHFKEEI